MSPRLRFASISVASASAVALCVAIGVASPAAAEPCTDAAAAAQPAAPAAPAQPLPTTGGPPRGHRPPNANANAPLPRLGQISRALLNAFTPQTGQVQKQAEVAPQPIPPAAANQQQPVAAQPVPEAAPAPPPAPATADPPGTSLVGWVTGPNSPNNTLERFAVSGTDLGIMWDNGCWEVLIVLLECCCLCRSRW
jgi:hypothetical protein